MAQRPTLIVTVILCTAYIVSAQCPGICDCSSYDSRKEIRCGTRDLTSIPSNLPPDTQILRLEFNRIESISSTDLSRMVNLKKLTLYNNIISFIDANAFEYQQDLEVLNLKYNRIRFIHNQTFRNTQKLVELSLDNNLLQFFDNDTFSGLLKLNDLEIDGNPLQSLPEGIFNGLTNLRLLDISNVVFEAIPSNLFDGLSSLVTLKMNNVTQNGDHLFGSEFIFASVPSLITLEVRQNSLHCLPVSLAVLRSLAVLKLSMNPLTCSNFTVLKQLQRLEELHMDQSGITKLSSNMFVGNTNLVFLLIEYSGLSTVEEGAFTGLSRLEDLYLSSNNITTLPDNVFDSLPSGVNLDLDDNPWNCDCDLRWLHTWLGMSYTGITPGDRQPECVSPNRLNGQQILDIDESEYACMPQTELNETMTHSVNEGENFVIECSITADPSPALHWLTPDHTELFPNTNQIPFIVDSKSTLTIIRIRKEDAGTYSCTGTNVAGTLNIRNVVNVVGTGNAPIFRTDSNLQSSTTITSQQSEPLKGGKNSTLVIIIAVVAFLIILVLAVVIVAVIRRRNKRKDRFRHGPEDAVFRNGRATLPSLPPCTHQENMAMPYAASDDRYTLQRQPTTSVLDPPPPYSTIPPSPNDDIYQEIKNDDDLYEKPREPGDMSPASVRPDHTYMAQVLRQDSFVSNGSGGVPAGYERSMIRDVGKPKRDTSSTLGSPGCSDRPANVAQRNIYVATNDVKDNNRQSNVEHNDLRVRVPDLSPEAKATYENTRRS